MESDMEKLMEHFFGNLISRERERECARACVWVYVGGAGGVGMNVGVLPSIH